MRRSPSSPACSEVPTYRLDLAYDGSGFHGFARQEGLRTVQGELESALARVAREPVATTAAGRTDRGVHARHQVVSFAVSEPLDLGRIVRTVNGLLAPQIAAVGAEAVPDDFSARFSARWREYRYFVLDRPHPDPLRRDTTWHVSGELDVARMNAAATAFVGEHDFSSFCRTARERSNVRNVLEAGWSRHDDLAVFTVRASAFCHQMVRSLVGFLVDVGRGRRDVASSAAVLSSRDRSMVGTVAPPHGLILWDVGY